MPHRIVIEPVDGRDAYGQLTYGAAQTYQARIVGKARLVRDFAGKEVASTITIYVAGAPDVRPEDRLTLPAGDFAVEQPPILSAGRHWDETGLHHAVLYC